MNNGNIVYPDIFGSHTTAFFTGKSPGADLDRISNIASVSKEKIYLPIQKHTDKVLLLDSDFSPRIADAVITKGRGILIGVQVADCVPVLLSDTKKSVLGLCMQAGGHCSRDTEENYKFDV